MSHSCGRYRVADHFAKAPQLIPLYRDILDLVRTIGPVQVDPQRRGIAFQVRARSISVNVHRDWLELVLWLKRPATHPRVRRTEDYGKLGFIMRFRIDDPADLDDDLRRLLAKAYAVGAQGIPTSERVARASGALESEVTRAEA